MSQVAFLTGCDLNYLPGALATLRSAARHHPDVTRFCVVPPADREAMGAALGDLATVLTIPRPVVGVSDRMQTAYGKIFLTELLGDFEAVLWVDSDAVLVHPVPELFRVAPGRVNAVGCNPLNRVPHNLPPALRGRFEEVYPEVSAVPGFNGGVFALRPADWPRLVPDVEGVIARLGYPSSESFFEQALLNALWFGRLDYLPFEYNWTELFDDPPPSSVRIVHFASRPKPWMPGYPKHEPAYWFWVRHGLGVTDPVHLAKAKARIWLHSPKRWLSQGLRGVGLR